MSIKQFSLLILILILFLFNYTYLSAQICTSDRYKNELFSSQVTQDILFANADPYGISSSQDLKLDFYEPIGDTNSNRPLIIYAFGGAYLIGDKRQPDIPAFCNHFARQGFAVASIDYRIGFNTLSSGSAIRAVYRGIQDLRAAVRFLCENRLTYRIDTNYIFYSGSSAGCISALHATFMTDADRPSYTYGGVVLLEPDDMGCADCSGNNLYGNRVPKPAGILSRWGAILDTSFISNIIEDSVPVISFHGTSDNAVPYTIGNPFSFPIFPVVMGSAYIHNRLNNLNIYNQLVPLVGAGHEPELLEPRWDDTIFIKSTPFLYQILKPKTSPINGVNNVCLFDTVIYNVINHPNSFYCWKVDSTTQLIFQNNNLIKVVFTTLGNHIISVREFNNIQCMGDSISTLIYVIDKPTANFTQMNNELNISFTNTSLNASTYRWYFGDGTSSTNVSPNHIYSDTGNYTVILIASNGSCIDTIIKNIYVYKCPQASFTYFIDNSGHIILFNNSVYADSILWTFGDGDSTSLNNPEHDYINGATYTLTLNAFMDTFCIDTQSVIINREFNSINPNQELLTMNIFPNPANQYIQLSNWNNLEKIEIFNSLNQIINTIIPISSDNYINIETLENGLYYIKMQTKKECNMYKFIKQ